MGSEQTIAIAADAEPCRLPLTVEDFLILDEAGAVEEVGKVELIEAEIFRTAPLHRPYARVTMILRSLLDAAVEALGGALEALSEPSAELDTNNLPRPCIVIADAEEEDLVAGRTVRLLIATAASSLEHDPGRKLHRYARTGVPECWVADVTGRAPIRFYALAGEHHTERATFAFGDAVPSATTPGLVVDTARLG